MGLAHRLGHSAKRVSHILFYVLFCFLGFFLYHFKAMTRSDSSKCVASSRLRSFHNKCTVAPRPRNKRGGALFFLTRTRWIASEKVRRSTVRIWLSAGDHGE